MAQRQHAADAADDADLAQLSADVERWRRTRAKLSPMPTELWDAATAVARRLGVNRVKEALGLNYGVLKARSAAGGRQLAQVRQAATGFVELSGAQMLGLPGATGAVVELVDAQGTRLTVRLAAGAECDVVRLVEVFRRPAA